MSKMPAQTSLFQVYLRLRPPIAGNQGKRSSDAWLVVERPALKSPGVEGGPIPSSSTHITLQPPHDSRKRAVERFGFTKVFQEDASQLDIFEETGTSQSVRTLLTEGRDGLVATLGVTGSGKVGIPAGDVLLNGRTDGYRVTPFLAHELNGVLRRWPWTSCFDLLEATSVEWIIRTCRQTPTSCSPCSTAIRPKPRSVPHAPFLTRYMDPMTEEGTQGRKRQCLVEVPGHRHP